MPLERLSSNAGSLARLSSNSSALTPIGSSGGGLQRVGNHLSGIDKIGAFSLSALESFPELFGIEPTVGTQAYRASNPIGGFASQAVGAFVPYLGAAKVLRAIPLVEAGIGTARAAGGTSAIAQGALGMAAEAGFVEAARLGISATGAPEALYKAATGRDPEMRSATDMVLESAFNVAGSGVLGGVGGALAGRFARPTNLSNFVPELDAANPLPVRIRAVNEFIAKAQNPEDALSVPDELLGRLSRERETLMRINLEHAMPTTSAGGESTRSGVYRRDIGRSFRPIENGRKAGKNDAQSNFLNRASNWRSQAVGTQNRRLIIDPTGKGGFSNARELDDAIGAIGLSREELAMEATDIMTVRVRSGVGSRLDTGDVGTTDRLLSQPPVFANKRARGGDDVAKTVQKQLATGKAVQQIGNGWNLMRERGENGLYVLTKKIRGGAEPAAGDEWVFLRTDNPGAFDPKSANLMKQMTSYDGYFPVAKPREKIGSAMWDADVDLSQMLEGNISTRLRSPIKDTGGLGRIQAVGRELADLGGDYLAPSAPGSTRNALANYAWNRIKASEAFVADRVDSLMRGTRLLDQTKSIGRQVAGFDEFSTGGLDEMAKALPKEALDDIRFVLEGEVPHEQLQDLVGRGLLHPEAKALLDVLQKYSDDFGDEVSKIGKQSLAGPAEALAKGYNPRKGHYIFTREYQGAYRYMLNGADGEVRGVAAGRTPLEARERAMTLIEDNNKSSKPLGLQIGAFVDEALQDPVQVANFKRGLSRPGFLKNRSDLLGYELQGKELTGKKLSALIERNMLRRENFLKDIVIADGMAPVLAKLERENPSMRQFIQKRIAIMGGDEGEFGRAQNQIMDKALGIVGLSGKNSASAIVSQTQKVLSDFQFGFANLVNPIQNLLGIFQTVLPELSFAARVSQASAHNYAALPVYDAADNLVGSVNMLSDVKLFYSAMKNAFTPLEKLDPAHRQLIDDMIRQRYLAPRFAEEQFGTNSALLKDPMAAIKNGEFVEFMGAANRVMVTKSEEFNRVIAVNAAYEIGKMRGMNQGQLTVFTRDFLNKTAFAYGTADRATVHTTPIGGLLGTFKNWQFHYMANMLKYAGGGKDTLPAFFWQTASTALIGGAAATPLVMPIVDGASKFLTDKSAMENLYAGFGEKQEALADGILYGLPGAMGLSFASQVASPGADPERDATMLFSFAASDRMRALGSGTKAALAAYAATGESPFTDDNVRNELARALAPRSIYRAMAVGQDGAIRSMSTGYDVARLGLGGAAAYALGFNPTELEKTYEVYNNVRNSQEAKKALTGEFGATLAQALESGDNVLANRVYMRAQATGVDSGAVLRSANARMRRGEETQLEFTADPQSEQDYQFMFPEQ